MRERQDRPLYAVGDIHGHRDELVAALRETGLVDDAGDWTGQDVDLWFMGDFVDRGPDGIGVIDLVMRLAEQARESAGTVDSVLGNHEVLMLGYHRFGDTSDATGLHSFGLSWLRNGGQESDQAGLTDEHIEWLRTRPAVTRQGEHLLMHADTTGYLDWGATIDEINATVAGQLTGDDLDQWFTVWRTMTARHAFRDNHGQAEAERMLGVLGGEQIVHGHSIIAEWLGVDPKAITGPMPYAGDRVLGIDGGLYDGGPCLVVELPYADPAAS
ncbi:metallophosphoesterase [Luteipulveratus mongoliensis]|uniref:Serine/threonine protein phosphatase n=1 Tax=Luteipulveratus mongoliensis TaxID=571913 RepID=A0A0K1JN00_9MICO|nr:metallophosphoesterase [Luteipulveratus mongoliensis]AKU17963.1 serine/threonine protein phosphatase [Luteipulveratus mongoliensis]